MPHLTKTMRRLPNNIRRYRRRRNLLVKEVVKIMGLKHGRSLTPWERGYCQPTLINAIWLSVVIACPIEVLYFEHFQAVRAITNRRRLKMKFKYPGF
jgi:transcriptional regulator with XRE-family HTH domain